MDASIARALVALVLMTALVAALTTALAAIGDKSGGDTKNNAEVNGTSL